MSIRANAGGRKTVIKVLKEHGDMRFCRTQSGEYVWHHRGYDSRGRRCWKRADMYNPVIFHKAVRLRWAS